MVCKVIRKAIFWGDLFCIFVAMSDLVHDVQTVVHLTANSIWKSSLKYESCQANCKLQFPVHHLYFKIDFQIVLSGINI